MLAEMKESKSLYNVLLFLLFTKLKEFFNKMYLEVDQKNNHPSWI